MIFSYDYIENMTIQLDHISKILIF